MGRRLPNRQYHHHHHHRLQHIQIYPWKKQAKPRFPTRTSALHHPIPPPSNQTKPHASSNPPPPQLHDPLHPRPNPVAPTHPHLPHHDRTRPPCPHQPHPHGRPAQHLRSLPAYPAAPHKPLIIHASHKYALRPHLRVLTADPPRRQGEPCPRAAPG